MAGSGVSPLEGARNRYISELISQTQAALGDVPLELRRQILDTIDKALETGLHNVEERICSYHQDFCKPDLDQEGLMQISHQLIYMENLLMQIFRNKRTEIEIDQSENEEYQVHSTPKGIAIIICNPKSNPHAELHRYFEKDAAKLYRTFQKLDFDTRLHTNISKRDMKALMYSVAQMDHSQFDAFVCVIHTETKIIKYRQCVLDAKAAPVPFQDLKDMFNASRCPTLSGKPKVFLIPCGQGDNFMSGVKPGSRTGNDTTVPSEADFLVLQATAPGFNVIGDDEFSGTLWVKRFTELMDRGTNNIDVVTCMTHLAAEISCQDLWGFCKQSPHIESTLRKPLFFREMIPDDKSTV